MLRYEPSLLSTVPLVPDELAHDININGLEIISRQIIAKNGPCSACITTESRTNVLAVEVF